MAPSKAIISEITTQRIGEAAGLLAILNPDSRPEVIEQRLQTILNDHPHYQLWGAFLDDRLLGLAGAWVATKIWCGRYLEVDNLVVDPESRSTGIGTQLIKHLESIARERDCNILSLDSYTSNRSSHRLYHKLGFEIWGFHFIREVGDHTGESTA